MLALTLRSARLISVYLIVQVIIGHPGSLYLTGIGPDRSLLILVAKNTFFSTLGLTLLFAHILDKFSIGRDLLDSI